MVIDDEPFGPAPAEKLLLSEGRHRVEVTRTGYAPVEVKLTLKGGEVREVQLDPTAAGGATATAPPPIAPLVPAPAVAPQPGLIPLVPSPATPADTPKRPWLLPVSLGAAGAVIVAAVVTVVVLFAGPDDSARGRGLCGSDCVLLEGGLR